MALLLGVACLIACGAGRSAGQTVSAPWPPARNVDVRRLQAAGLRVLEGQHVRLVTDLAPSKAVDELPAVFDAAVPQWAAYFGMNAEAVRGRWLAVVMADRQQVGALGLLPTDNVEFVNGYAKGYEFWLVEQPSDYYLRHLLLHEGTHAFMQTQLGGCGAPWYMEGMAELLGTHRWQDGRLELGVMPASREASPMWGRIKVIRDAAAAGDSWPLERVLAVDNSRSLEVDQYAWTWALAKLLDSHPRFQAPFRALREHVADPKFNERFRAAFAESWSELDLEWNAYVAALDYGYDVPRMAMVHREASPIGDAGGRVKIVADRGWQSTGWQLLAGQSYRLSARGRYQIADDGRPWPCEPAGVTIEYHDGQPLGARLGALAPGDGENASFARPAIIGSGATLRPARDAVLYVRVNDSPAKLNDNAGELSLEIVLAPDQ
jgi:hypothetical protein